MGQFTQGYREYYQSLSDKWTWILKEPFWQHGTVSLSLHQIKTHKKTEVICLHTKVNGEFEYPFKLIATMQKLKANVNNNNLKVQEVHGCLCALVPLDPSKGYFKEGFAHIAGVDYPNNWQDLTWKELNGGE
jgi:hypothetical protein